METEDDCDAKIMAGPDSGEGWILALVVPAFLALLVWMVKTGGQ